MKKIITSAELDDGGEPPDHQDMNARIDKLEHDVTDIKVNVGVLMANSATKADISGLWAYLKAEFHAVRSTTKAELDASTAVIRAEMASNMTTIRSEMAGHRTATKAEMEAHRAATKAEMEAHRAATKADIPEAKNSIIMWVVSAVLLGQLVPSVVALIGRHV
jgi:hypothetical protein